MCCWSLWLLRATDSVAWKMARRSARQRSQSATQARRTRRAQKDWNNMSNKILIFYGSYRSDRMGIRLADYLLAGLRDRGDDVELIDAKAVGLPMLDRMYKEYTPGSAPPAMAALAA